jgi:hypothetical protein
MLAVSSLVLFENELEYYDVEQGLFDLYWYVAAHAIA